MKHHCCQPEPLPEIIKENWVDDYYIRVRDRDDSYEVLVGQRDHDITTGPTPFVIDHGIWVIAVTSVQGKAFTGFALIIDKEHISLENLIRLFENYIESDKSIIRERDTMPIILLR